MPDSHLWLYKNRRYAGITWHVGATTFYHFNAAAKHATIFDELRVCVNGQRWDIDRDSFPHEHTATIRPYARWVGVDMAKPGTDETVEYTVNVDDNERYPGGSDAYPTGVDWRGES